VRQKCLHPSTELRDVRDQKIVIERRQLSPHYAGIPNYTFCEQL